MMVALEAQRLLDTALRATPPVMLRSLDGLHLGAMRAAKLQSVVTADLTMRDAAGIANVRVIVP